MGVSLRNADSLLLGLTGMGLRAVSILLNRADVNTFERVDHAEN